MDTPALTADRTAAITAVRLHSLMERTAGRPEITVGLIDGPVARGVASLPEQRMVRLGAGGATDGPACAHGTFIASILVADRGSGAPAICPGCTLITHPLFGGAAGRPDPPAVTGEALADAIHQIVDAGARVLNLSLTLFNTRQAGERAVRSALDTAARRGAVVLAAAGNQGTLASTVITAHPWVVPVAASDAGGRPLAVTNLGHSIGRRGLCAPGLRVPGLTPAGAMTSATGTSVAVPFVTGAAALLWSQYPAASAADIRRALLPAGAGRRRVIVPPLLDAEGAHRSLPSIMRSRT